MSFSQVLTLTAVQGVILSFTMTKVIPHISYLGARDANYLDTATLALAKSIVLAGAKLLVIAVADLLENANVQNTYTTVSNVSKEVVAKSIMKIAVKDGIIAVFGNTALTSISAAFIGGVVAQGQQFALYHNATTKEIVLQGFIGGLNYAAYQAIQAIDTLLDTSLQPSILVQILAIEGVENFVQDMLATNTTALAQNTTALAHDDLCIMMSL